MGEGLVLVFYAWPGCYLPGFFIGDMSMEKIEKVIEAFKRGEIVIITDDEGRENEGDLIMSAEKATPEAVNFMATHGRGLICVSLPGEKLKKLGLKRMPPKGKDDPFQTAFMESVDAGDGITTGISAYDRAKTIAVLMDDSSTSDDLVVPGHTFPLEAAEGGVLRRSGHTEASVDLSRMAGLKPGGVICEIMREDGEMARMPELKVFAKEHNLLLASIADLIAFRRKNEDIVEFVRCVSLPNKHADFKLHLYRSTIDNENHIAMVLGDVTTDEPVLVRVHSECFTGDVLGSHRCDCGLQLEAAMKMVGDEGRGVILYMKQEGRGIGLANKLHAYQLQEEGLDTVEANEKLGFPADLRDYGVGAQILKHLGLSRIRLITNNPRKIVGLEGHGLEITKRVGLVCESTEHSARYLATKKEKLGHLL
jgi:3,4-dihydroxy 2-butanone 4-phosphate synthase/GTP cyclohydrolase II